MEEWRYHVASVGRGKHTALYVSKSLFTAQNKGRDSVNWGKRKKIKSN